jgi:DsbC/DsbD-like thiol-disulfide interchange protein
VPERSTDPVELRLKAFFGVCKEVCIPVEGHAELASWQGDPDAEAALESFESRVPAKADASSPLRVTRAFLSGSGSLGLTVEGAAPTDLDVFIESGDTSYFRAPRLIASNTYLVAIEGSPNPSRLTGAKLKLTLVGGNVALEQDVVVD